MAKRSKAETLKARFPRLKEIREQRLGWEVIDLVAKLPGNRPSIASIYRLEAGRSVRIANARRVFDVLNEALGNSLKAESEIVLEEMPDPSEPDEQ
jgi:hypothetical protein